MNDLLRLCDCVMCVLRNDECIDAVYACLCEIWRKQNRLSCCSALFLMFCPKISTQRHSKTHFLCCILSSLSLSLMFKWLSLASNTKVHIAETNPAHANNMRFCYRKKKAAKYHCWADVKNPQADLIPYLHLKDHSTFKHKLMMHNVISISSKCLQQTFHLYK